MIEMESRTRNDETFKYIKAVTYLDEYLGAVTITYDFEDKWNLQSLEVKEGNLDKVEEFLIEELTELLDEEEISLEVKIEPCEDTRHREHIKLYKKYGFEEYEENRYRRLPTPNCNEGKLFKIKAGEKIRIKISGDDIGESSIAAYDIKIWRNSILKVKGGILSIDRVESKNEEHVIHTTMQDALCIEEGYMYESYLDMD